jgi:hypothetical protein
MDIRETGVMMGVGFIWLRMMIKTGRGFLDKLSDY